MRAKTINEIQNFEKTGNPKASMGMGGINFEEQFHKFYDDWSESMKSLIGKTITAHMEKHWMEHGESKSDEGTMTVKIGRVDNPGSGASRGSRPVQWKLYFNDTDDIRYSMFLDQKIYIK